MWPYEIRSFRRTPKSKNFTQQFFLLRVLKFKKKIKSWPVGLFIHHFKCHCSYLSPTNFWQKTMQLQQFFETKTLWNLFFPQFSSHQKYEKHPFNTNLLQKLFEGEKPPGVIIFPPKIRLPETKPLQKLPTKISSQKRLPTFHRSKKSSHGWKLRVFPSCGRDNHKFVICCATNIYWKTWVVLHV